MAFLEVGPARLLSSKGSARCGDVVRRLTSWLNLRSGRMSPGWRTIIVIRRLFPKFLKPGAKKSNKNNLVAPAFGVFGLLHSIGAREPFKNALAGWTSAFFVEHFWRLLYSSSSGRTWRRSSRSGLRLVPSWGPLWRCS